MFTLVDSTDAVRVVSAGAVTVRREGLPVVLAAGAMVKGADVPVTVVLPFKETAPVPVEKVVAPDWEILPSKREVPAWIHKA